LKNLWLLAASCIGQGVKNLSLNGAMKSAEADFIASSFNLQYVKINMVDLPVLSGLSIRPS
jgi:hypothetical protein